MESKMIDVEEEDHPAYAVWKKLHPDIEHSPDPCSISQLDITAHRTKYDGAK